ncbi:hypothetical protein LSTR_LSTR009103 [Laodelphax striatellus]|uniref:Protein farnesyltransferase/geranylgeranyltransferase type-1 subunit alpha n=1 Tax=Laodelphax striatellus TaxID=195883 RepID=A0A482XP64_LAOST|nr:hypothetical protein LSTR_LSTR009103 [Laodelphax striatellus]
MEGSSSEEGEDVNWTFYRDREEWADLKPVPQDDGPHPVVAIAYSEKFRDVFDYFRGVLKVHELSERALDLTRDAVELNPGNYTVWQYRRQILKHLDKDLKEEMAFVAEMISAFPKNYQVWHHRQVLVSWLNDASDELQLTAKMLALDAKNYHAWQHRQWAIRTFNLFQNELEFIEKLLNDDIRNNSAWNQRYFVINQTTEFAPEVIEKEIAYVLSKIKIATKNESSWNYLRGIVLHSESGLRKPSVIDFCDELYNSGNRSACLLSYLVDAALEQAEYGVVKENSLLSIDKALELCDNLANEFDVCRRGYWNYISGCLRVHMN